jgi:putative ABC transport system permease protein
MLRDALRNLVAHRRRLMATAIAVMLGVSFMAGTLVLTDTVTHTFNSLFATVYKGTDAVVREVATFNGIQNTGAQRGRVDASLLPQLESAPGVAAGEGVVEGYARIIGSNGKALGNPVNGAPALGISWISNPHLNPFTLLAGRAPAKDDEVVIDKKSASDGHLAIGDWVTILVQGPPQRFLITGIVGFGGADSPGGATCALFTLAAAQKYVGEPGKYDYMAFIAQPGVSQTQLARSLQAALPTGMEAVTGAQVTREAQSQIGKDMSFFNTFMLIFAVVALLVGGFMIFNAFSITVAQRTRENGLLRALGATRRQVRRSVLLEAGLVGLLASAVGLFVGLLVAGGLKSLLGAMGIDIPAGGLVFAPRTVVVALVAGIGVTVVAALFPARRAGRVSPIAAMTDSPTSDTGGESPRRALAGTGVLSFGIAALFVGLYAHVKSPVMVVGAGAVLVFLGVALLGQVLSLPVSRVLGAPVARTRGIAGVLSRQNAMRNPRRTATTAAALMVCVGMVGFMTIFASSARASINSIVDQSFTGDYVINSGAGLTGGFDPSLTQRLSRLPQLSAVTGLRVGMALINGSSVQLAAVDPTTAFKLFNVKPLQGSEQDLGANAIAVYKNVANSKHLKIGDLLPVTFKDTGNRLMHVALIYGSNQPAGDYFIGTSAYEANFANQYDSYIFVKRAAGVTPRAALAAINSVANQYPGAQVLDQNQWKAQVAQPINQLLGLVYVLILLAVIIALLGIGNTMALSVYERNRELGILRAVGMTRKQLRATIRWEAVLIALQGTILGLIIAAFFGWALVGAMKSQGFNVLSLPYMTLAEIALLGAIAGMLAAIGPARRAAKRKILKAVTSP